MKRWLALVALALGASGCASLSESECLVGDWYTIGERDGRNGREPEVVNNHYEACSQYGVEPVLDIWRAGYERGLDRYCTPMSAVVAGANLQTYNGVCYGRDEDLFLTAYEDGRQHASLRQEYNRAETEVGEIRRDIRKLEDERDEAYDKLDDEDLLDEERRALRRRIDAIGEDIHDYRRDLRRTERRSDRLFSDLLRWSNELSYRYDGLVTSHDGRLQLGR